VYPGCHFGGINLAKFEPVIYH